MRYGWCRATHGAIRTLDICVLYMILTVDLVCAFHTHTHIYIYIYIYMYIFVGVWCVCVCAFHTHTHTHTHIYIYIYIVILSEKLGVNTYISRHIYQ